MNDVWISVCDEDDLVIGSGVCALVDHGAVHEQIALFRETPAGPVYALSNYDPIGDAFVISRGIIGSVGAKLVVASPLYKQHFCLVSGQCLEDESVRISAWPARIHAGKVQLKMP